MWGTYEDYHPRTRNILRGLELNGVTLRRCHRAAWAKSLREDKTTISPLRFLALAARVLLAYARLIPAYFREPDHDVVLVLYFGHLDVFVARVLAWLRRKPLVFAADFSLYDTVVNDRRLAAERSWIGRICRTIDRWACRLADVVLLDTAASIRYFEEEFGIPTGKFLRVWVGADDQVFQPLPGGPSPFLVMHFGKYIPLHGMDVIVDAAWRLRSDDDVRFLLVGHGQDYARIRARVESLGLANVEFVEWLEPVELRRVTADAAVCLGIFGMTPKASRVIPNKVYEALAMGKVVITGDSPAIRELLIDGENVRLAAMGDPAALEKAIRDLKADPGLRERLGANGLRLFRAVCTPEVIGRELAAALQRFVARGSVLAPETEGARR